LFLQSSLLGNNPFAVLTAIVAPAILTNASSVLALGTSNRLGRVVDRPRVVYSDLAATAPGSQEHTDWTAQLAALRARAQMLLRALRLFYAALGFSPLQRWSLSVARLRRFTEKDCSSKALPGWLS